MRRCRGMDDVCGTVAAVFEKMAPYAGVGPESRWPRPSGPELEPQDDEVSAGQALCSLVGARGIYAIAALSLPTRAAGS